ncbi:aminodeoxychorismate/anthranilate synthase component II [Aliiglaciecola sp. LCG003]|uniref:aminodeoxychorismate/anthranilate synthase component II n=1 Tax=Aliiglaciecola sp. LCG003 TaxID=3053655 RepID=UPI00257403FB|nr:aminodeoxychorismate/anthranilate synthase component II [Aliiglaciecola sp. LCG003]WJG10848.1 aminodeoxychorismate/anthranilate synthase component II [Aliiglaciecola sp. LCG003]
MNKPISVFLLDNFDSFTYNLVDELRGLGHELTIYRNSVSADKIFKRMQQQSDSSQVVLLLSPGPGTPKDAGCLLTLLNLVKGHFPVLGICLGHQAIVQSYGGDVVRSDEVMHGKASYINHSAQGVFANLPSPLPVARYHSLMASNMPPELPVIAQYNDIPMAVSHTKDMMLGFQFHPESILTSQGSQLLDQSIHYLTQKA